MSFSIIEEPKNPEEIHPYGVDFTNGIADGDSISAQDVEIYDEDREDVTSTMLDAGSVALNGNIVSCRVEGGTDGNKYSVRFEATLTSGALLQHILILSVKDQRR